MEVNQRVEVLEKEFKLIKGELKGTLASVRDYLMSFKLPPPGDSKLLSALDADDKQTVVISGAMSHSSDVSYAESPKVVKDAGGGSVAQPGKPSEGGAGQAAESVARHPGGEDLPSVEEVETAEPSVDYGGGEAGPGRIKREAPERFDDRDMLEERLRQETAQSTPRVNLLSNIIRWVAYAKREIGEEQLASFLEVYGISGHLSPELQEVILHLMEITEPNSGETSSAEAWSRLILELHGILTGGDAPDYVVRPLWNSGTEELLPDEAEAADEVPKETAEEKTLKLKLVFTNADGSEKEVNVDLSPEVNREPQKASLRHVGG